MNARAPDFALVESQFPIPGEFIDAVPYGTGHINDTYCTRFAMVSRMEAMEKEMQQIVASALQ